MDCFNCCLIQLNEIIVDDYIYSDCQLPNIVLNKIKFRICPYCGARYAVIENMMDLHQTIALELVNKKAKLTNREISFLLKLSGYHEVDIAPMMNCNVSTVNEWEIGQAEMSEIQEQFFRSLMASKLKKMNCNIERKFLAENTASVIILHMNENGEWEVKNRSYSRSNG